MLSDPRVQVVVGLKFAARRVPQGTSYIRLGKTPNMHETKVVLYKEYSAVGILASGPAAPASGQSAPAYLVKARMILADIWRKKMDAMKERERTRTMKGSLRAEILE